MWSCAVISSLQTQMCQLHPKTKEEMLMVSGVGENKFRKYGEAFLALLNEERQD